MIVSPPAGFIASFFGEAASFQRLGRSTWRRGSEPFVLACYPELAVARFDFVLSLQRKLAELELAPEVVDFDRDRRVLVSRSVDGSGTRDPDVVGLRLGELHRALRELEPEGEGHLHEAPREPLRALRALRANASSPEAAAALDYKIRRVERMEPCVPPNTALVHGDVHPGNLVGAPERPVFIDFDRAGKWSQLYELLRALMLFAFDASANDLDEVWAGRFLRAYHDVVSTDAPVRQGVQAYVWMLATSGYGLDGQYLDFGLRRLAILKWFDGEGQARVERLLGEIVGF